LFGRNSEFESESAVSMRNIAHASGDTPLEAYSFSEGRLHGFLMIFDSWLEIASKQEMQARQTRQNLVFAALTAGVGLAMLFIRTAEGNYYYIVPLGLMILCSTVFNHFYQRKAAFWKKTSKRIVSMQEKIIRSNDGKEIYEELSRFHFYQTYKIERSKLRWFYLETPSVMLYVALLFSIVSLFFMLDLNFLEEKINQ